MPAYTVPRIVAPPCVACTSAAAHAVCSTISGDVLVAAEHASTKTHATADIANANSIMPPRRRSAHAQPTPPNARQNMPTSQ